jgi:sugar phosphate isomerase/epimerase
MQFGISQFSTWPQSFEEDLQLYERSGIQYIEVCEGKLEIDNPHPQLQRLQETGLKVPSVQPRLHSLFPDRPRPLPESPGDRMVWLRDTVSLFGPYFPGATIVTITGAAPGGNYDFAYRTAAREYKEAARVAVDQGVRLALEPLRF